MSLQVCHCGWSKVTSYHGLRTHQGKMGCTPKGVKVEESEQLYTWGNLGFTMDLVQDAYSSIKTDYYSDLSLQVCHCGWSKMTTFQGLRTHQGKMGCTRKGMRIQEREQYDWKNQYEEVDQRKYQPPKKTIVKKEHVPSPPSRPSLPSTKVRTNSASATIKEEYKSHVATSQHSLQTATKSHRQLQDFSTGVQARRHPTPTYPETVVRPKVKDRKDQKLSQMADSRVMAEHWSIRIGTTATIKEEPESPSAIRHFQRTSNPKSGRQPQVRENPVIPPHAAVAQPKRKDRENQTAPQTRETAEAELQKKIQLREEKMSEIREWTERTCESVPDSTRTNTQANSAAAMTKKKEDPKSLHEAARPDFSTGMKVKRLNMECPTTHPAPVVRSKEKDGGERTLLQKVPVLPSISSEKVVKIKEEPKSPFATPQQSLQRATNSNASHRLQEFCTGVQMNRSSYTGSTTPPLATGVQPKENDSKDQIAQNFPDSASSTIQMNPSSAETITEEDPHSLCKTAQPLDFSTGLKVKELAQIISAITTQKTTARLKEKEREAELIAQKLSTTTGQETAVHPTEKDKEDQTLSQNLPVSSNATTQMDPASPEATPEENPKSSCETAQVSDCSTGLKVKELARMFSTTTTQETTVQPKGTNGEERKLSQNLPDSTSANTKMNPASAKATTEDEPKPLCETAQLPDFSTGLKKLPESTRAANQMNAASAKATTEENPKPSCEAAQLPDFSTGLKVKDLARMFLATTTQDTTVRPKWKNREEPRQSHMTRLIARKPSAATGQETAVQPKRKDKENQNLSQNVPESTRAATQMNAASAKATTEENPKPSCEAAQLPDFSTALKVKELARMFSAVTTQDTTVRPKGKNREERKLSQAKSCHRYNTVVSCANRFYQRQNTNSPAAV